MHTMLLYIPTLLFIQIIGFQTVGAYSHRKKFCSANLRILWETFGKHSYINRTEVERLAEMVDAHPEQVQKWFQHQRTEGTVAYMYKTVERETEVITHILLIF